LALAFLFAFAACGGNGGEKPANAPTDGEITTTAPQSAGETTTQDTSASGETTTQDSEPEPGGATTTEPGEGASTATGVPTDMAGVIRYYNEALAKTPMQRTSYTRTMTKITALVKALFLTIMDEPYLHLNDDVKPYVYYEDKTARPSDLTALEAGWVKDAKASVSGSTATLTITMKDYGLDPDFDPKPGLRGYVSTLDRATVEPLVVEVAMALAASVISPNALRDVQVLNSVFGQSGGKYTVSVDTETGRIKALTFTGSQVAEGNAKCVVNIPLIQASANAFVTLQGDLVAVYAPK
jgi:hypothetical protein